MDLVMTNTQALISWAILVFLTVLSVYLGQIIHSTTLFSVFIFAIVFFKGQLITDIFMELKYAPSRWRIIMLGYVLIVPSIICAIYLI
ncbi:cytochrome C oxidase subunit IV family protein [Thalassotalea profundi]|uniref:Thiosulfate reductase n=1 Tax=Thalassotalea profundi TaxID=2036687 RepID=A0ABQ3IGR7_9GAMM|nr:hypothetical protein GCM10011501_10760 [Thalassotalea profundi]